MTDNMEETIIIPKFTKDDYHIPEPKQPTHDSRAWGLAMPAVMGVVGLGAFALLAYTFKELDLIGQTIRSHIVLWGAVALAVGGEVGTLFTNLEIFRKVRQDQATKWDWSGLITSMLATVLAFLLAAARLLGADVVWSDFIKTWGQIVLILVSALDQYAGQMELGLYIGSYDTRHDEWEKDYHDWLEKMALAYGIGSKDILLNGHTISQSNDEKNNAGLCWCGMECRNRQHYAAHVQHDHYPEIAEYSSGVAARQEMAEKYADTIPGATWEFPALEWFNRVRERRE